MHYNIINKFNFRDIEKIMSETEKLAKSCYKKDRFGGYKTASFAILGSGAISMFEKKYGYNFINYANSPKTDGKTRCVAVPYFTCSCYYDARDGGRGGLTDIFNSTEIRYLIDLDGILLRPAGSFDSPVEFTLFNDATNYYDDLPYGWDGEHPRPNRVGTITDKKMECWMGFLQERRQIAVDCHNKTVDAMKTFLSHIRLAGRQPGIESKIGERSGYLVCNGIRFEYSISSSGYIDQKIKIDGRVGCLDGMTKINAFMQMAYGRYGK